MAEANVASRRGAEELIERGRVRVNGKIATIGDKADPETDVIEVDGEQLHFGPQNKVYFALYKPRQVLTTSQPHRGDERRTVLDLIPYKGHLFSIGRLDADSEGLVVLTNDGVLTQRLTHPRFHHTKTYKVTVHGLPSEDVIRRWQDGVWLEEDGKTAPCSVTIAKGGVKETVLRIVMTEGKKRQIRRVAAALGHPVQSLVRTHIGMLSVEGLRPGEWRELTPREVHALGTPSPVLKELRARRWEQQQAERAQQRRAAASGQRQGDERPRRRRDDADFDSRTRRRSLVDDAAGERRPRRPEGETRTSDRPERGYSADKPRDGERPRRSVSAGDRPRRSFGDKPVGERRPRRPSSPSSEGGRFEQRRPRRDDTEVGSTERPRRRFEGGAGDEQRSRRTPSDRPRRPGYRSEADAENRPRRPAREGFGVGEDRPRRPRPEDAERRSESRPPRRDSDFGQSEDRPRRTTRTENRPGERDRSNSPRRGSSGPRRSSGGGPRPSERGGDRPPRRGTSQTRRRPSTSNPTSRGNEEE